MKTQTFSTIAKNTPSQEVFQVKSRILACEEDVKQIQSTMQDLCSLTIQIDFQMRFKKYLQQFIAFRNELADLKRKSAEWRPANTEENTLSIADKFNFFEKRFQAFKKEFNMFAATNLDRFLAVHLN